MTEKTPNTDHMAYLVNPGQTFADVDAALASHLKSIEWLTDIVRQAAPHIVHSHPHPDWINEEPT